MPTRIENQMHSRYPSSQPIPTRAFDAAVMMKKLGPTETSVKMIDFEERMTMVNAKASAKSNQLPK